MMPQTPKRVASSRPCQYFSGGLTYCSTRVDFTTRLFCARKNLRPWRSYKHKLLPVASRTYLPMTVLFGGGPVFPNAFCFLVFSRVLVRLSPENIFSSSPRRKHLVRPGSDLRGSVLQPRYRALFGKRGPHPGSRGPSRRFHHHKGIEARSARQVRNTVVRTPQTLRAVLR